MLKIRLKRVGRKHDPSFRLIVVESRRGPKSGDYIENLGNYNARTDEKNINTERVTHWLNTGAQTSGTAHNLLVELGVITGKKVNVLPKKTALVKEPSEEEKKEAPAPKEVQVEKSEVKETSKEEVTEAKVGDKTEVKQNTLDTPKEEA